MGVTEWELLIALLLGVGVSHATPEPWFIDCLSFSGLALVAFAFGDGERK